MRNITLTGLHKFNIFMGSLHLIQAIVVFILSSSTKGVNPVIISYLRFDPAKQKLIIATHHLFNLNLAYLVIAFFLISAIAHFTIATIYRKQYEVDLEQGINKARWFEYALSASVMMIAISLLSGIYDIGALLMIFTLDAIMNLMGLVMEVHNQKQESVSWVPYIIGCVAGIVPWIVFMIYLYGSKTYGGGNIPTFVYWIYASIFIFFNSFALNMFLQYKKIGPWKNYLYGERIYIILSLVAKSLLAWQVFAGTLRP